MIQPNFKVATINLGRNHDEIVIEPLPQNFGHTVGNALRRVLLSSLVGAAPVRVKIEGVQHQFSTLSGVQEDILQFVLNLKELRFVLESGNSAQVKLEVKGEGTYTGADLKLPAGVRLINPDKELVTLTTSKAKLVATIDIENGTGYVSSTRYATNEVGVIPLDATFSPILKANYIVEATRVGRTTNLDKVRMDIITDGSIDANSAVLESAKILSAFFNQVHNPVITEDTELTGESKPADSDQQLVEELDLPVRITNALKKGGYKTLNDLQKASVEDLVKVKNIGAKSAEEIITKAKEKGSK